MTHLCTLYLQNNNLDGFLKHLSLVARLTDPEFRGELVSEYLTREPGQNLSKGFLDIFSFITAILFFQDYQKKFSRCPTMRNSLYSAFSLAADAEVGEVYILNSVERSSASVREEEVEYVLVKSPFVLVTVRKYGSQSPTYTRIVCPGLFEHLEYYSSDDFHEYPATKKEIDEINQKIRSNQIREKNYKNLLRSDIGRLKIISPEGVAPAELFTVRNPWHMPISIKVVPMRTSKKYLRTLIHRLRVPPILGKFMTLHLSFALTGWEDLHVVGVSYNSNGNYYEYYDSNNSKGVVRYNNAAGILRDLERSYNFEVCMDSYHNAAFSVAFIGIEGPDIRNNIRKVFPEVSLRPWQFACRSSGISITKQKDVAEYD